MQNVDNILTLLPGSWDELKLKDFQKLLDVTIKETDEFEDMFVGMDNMLSVMSKLAGVEVKELEALPFASLQKLLTKLAFIQTEPAKKFKSSIKWKKLDEITYDDYVNYINLSKAPLQNLHAIIKTFSKTVFTEEDVLEMSMRDVHTGFFLLRKMLLKSIRRMYRQSAMALAWNRVKQAWNNLLHIRRNRKGKGVN